MNKEELEKLEYELACLENKYALTKDALELILHQLDVKYSEELREDNPIEYINFRIKKINSIQKKLLDKGRKCNSDNIDDCLSDIVGARIVCPFLSDVEKVVESLKHHPGLRVLISKDYIEKPKVNGYSSYHMIVVPVDFENQNHYVKAEIQVRTMLQDVWASLEHKICYKSNMELSKEAKYAIYKAAKEFRELDVKLNLKYLEEKAKRGEREEIFTSFNRMNSLDEEAFHNKYEYVLFDVLNRINYLNREYSLNIEHTKHRIKSQDRMFLKLSKRSDDLSIQSLENHVNDIAGVRIVCPFLSDLYHVVDTLKDNLGLEVVCEKNYVETPKKSGYAGYHLIVKVPVNKDNQVSFAKVEIQIRTVAMDMWANLEEILCYKKNASDDTKRELLNLAVVRQHIDQRVEDIIQEAKADSKSLKLVKNS